jgi:hypothetical protein
LNCFSPDPSSDLRRPVEIDVGYHHCLRPLARKPGCQGAPDASGPAGDHDYSANNVH